MYSPSVLEPETPGKHLRPVTHRLYTATQRARATHFPGRLVSLQRDIRLASVECVPKFIFGAKLSIATALHLEMIRKALQRMP